MGRPNWYYDHPPTCSCARCTERRLPGKGKLTLVSILQKIKALLGVR